MGELSLYHAASQITLGGLGLLVTALLALCVHVPPAKAVEEMRTNQEVAAEAQSETAVGDEVLSFGQLEAEPHAEPFACGEIPSHIWNLRSPRKFF